MTATALLGIPALGKPMNVVFILIDDLSHYGVTAYGANIIDSKAGYFRNVKFETPRIDSLARDGLRCDYAYVYPLCEPTRIALMSGKNNIRNYLRCKSQHDSDITFSDVFKKAGYKTCIVGKWKQTRGTKETPGKDYIYGFGYDEFCCFDVIREGKRMIDPDLVINGKVKKFTGIDPDTGRRYYGPDIFNRYALDFIGRNKDEPFFLYYSMVLMHDEHTPTPDTRPRSLFDDFDVTKKVNGAVMTGDDQRYFPDMLAYTDKMVGTVLDKLEELGLDDNTMVIVMGDNGTKESFIHRLRDGTAFRGGKGGNKENGLHVPLLIRAPGIRPKSVYKGLVNLTDIYPTLLEAAGITIPNPNEIDGISFWAQATGKSSVEHRDWIYTWYIGNNLPSETDLIIEYAFNKEFKRYAPSPDYPQGRFFDLRSDPFEEAGDRKVKVKKAWNKWHYSGLGLNKLTREQQSAYDRLGQVLEAKKYVPVKGLQVVKIEAPLRVGKSTTLECRVYPARATRQGLIWESSNAEIATVDKFGEVTAHKPGEVTISVYSWDDANPLAANTKDAYSRNGISSRIELECR